MTIRFDVKQSAAVQDIPGLFEIVPNNLGTLIASGDKKISKVVGDGQPPLPEMFLYKRHLVVAGADNLYQTLEKGVFVLVDSDPRPLPTKGDNTKKNLVFRVYVGLGGADGEAPVAQTLRNLHYRPPRGIYVWDTAVVICDWDGLTEEEVRELKKIIYHELNKRNDLKAIGQRIGKPGSGNTKLDYLQILAEEFLFQHLIPKT